jgi:hypothetical protein
VPRALAVARVSVPTAREGEYLALAGRLAALLKARGQHLWVFRHPDRPGHFLEFRESADARSHPALAPTPDEAGLIGALQEIASYGPGADDLWLDVSLPD